ncbi:MAG: hypothetical protein EOO91_07405 [Pedobacter sp.]|nr:MAG: hypothetical protein EOO91_07405 [Pedobacter sp.]
MLQKLSYFNLILAIVYLLLYLKSGTFNSTAGIFVIIVFSWLCMRSYQLDNYKWKIWHYLTGLWSLCFIGTIIYGIFNIVAPAIEYSFISNDTLSYLIVGVVFSVSVLIHIGIYFSMNYSSSK